MGPLAARWGMDCREQQSTPRGLVGRALQAPTGGLRDEELGVGGGGEPRIREWAGGTHRT